MSDQTRRDWVLTISQAAVALKVFGETANTAPLPPGVYVPSKDHLSHALMSADRYHPIPPECSTDYFRPTKGLFKPLFFSTAEFPVILRLTQLMLGDVTSDEGVSQEVAEWFDLHMSNVKGVHEAELNLDPLHRALAVAFYGPTKQRRLEEVNPLMICGQGIQWVRDAARGRYSKEFMSLDIEQQTAILRSISDETAQPENAATRFFTLLKGETIRGFYTSRVGLQELNFRGNAYYARSPGCNSK